MSTKVSDFCRQPLPRTAVQQRSIQGGRVVLSYVSGHYVTTALNECFGETGWSFHKNGFELSFEEPDDKGRHRAYCVYHGELSVEKGDKFISTTKEDVGFGSGIGRTKGEAVESAVKEARTDALKRCAKDFGPRFGLALYDKDQLDVEELSAADLIKQAENVGTQAGFDRWCYLAANALKSLSQEDRKGLKAVKKDLQKRLEENNG